MAAEIISHAPLGLYIPGLGGIALDLLAQAADMHVDRTDITRVVLAPDHLQKLGAAVDLTRMGGQKLQQLEFLAGQIDLSAGQCHAAVVQIHVQVAHLDDIVPCG